jgi:predicted esterase
MTEAQKQKNAQITWPARDENAVTTILEATPEKTFRLALRDGVELDKAPSIYMPQLTVPERTLVYKGLHAGGLFRVYEEPWTLESPDPGDRFVRRQLVGMYRSSFTPTTEDYKLRQAGIERYLKWSQREQKRAEDRLTDYGVRPQFTQAEAEISEGVYVTLPPPVPEPTRGVIIRMLALGGADYQRDLLTPARNQGWRVVNVGTAGALTGLVGRKTVVNIRTDEELDAAAKKIALLADEGLAEEAFAVQATMEYIKKERPDLARGPFVIMGFSLGALCTPAVYARLQETMPGEIKAAVLVGGGVNLLDITMRASLPGLELQINWGPGRGGEADKAKFVQRYLDHARLDPYHTAPLLRQIPVLQMHAQMDKIVPADTGEQLYELLGRPDRINFLGGHELLFYFMANQKDRVRDWLSKNVLEPWMVDVQSGRIRDVRAGGPDAIARRRGAASEAMLRRIDGELEKEGAKNPRMINGDEPRGGSDQSPAYRSASDDQKDDLPKETSPKDLGNAGK